MRLVNIKTTIFYWFRRNLAMLRILQITSAALVAIIMLFAAIGPGSFAFATERSESNCESQREGSCDDISCRAAAISQPGAIRQSRNAFRTADNFLLENRHAQPFVSNFSAISRIFSAQTRSTPGTRVLRI